MKKRDLSTIVKMQRTEFKFIIKNYPKLDFALDAKFKLDLIKISCFERNVFRKILY